MEASPNGTRRCPLRELLRVDEPALAHLIHGFLASRGIPSEIVGDQPFWADGSLVPKDMRPTLRVPDERYEEARQLLAEFEENRTRGEPWFCPECGDVLTPAFEECPVCGVVRPPRKPRSPLPGRDAQTPPEDSP